MASLINPTQRPTRIIRTSSLSPGETFGDWTFIRLTHRESNNNWRGEFRCVCGDIYERRISPIVNGVTTSCPSCSQKTHGKTGTPEYRAYQHAKSRCTTRKAHNAGRYIGRGIQFLFVSFDQWYEELGPRPTPQHSVHRIDNDGNYEPGNVAWALPTIQAQTRSSPRLTPAKVREIRRRLRRGVTYRSIQRHFRISSGAVCGIRRGVTWTNI
jgi:hypothetical protein